MSTPDQDVPPGWDCAEVGELATDSRDIAYGVLKPGPHTAGGVPMIKVTDIRTNQVKDDRLHLISTELDQEFRRTQLRGGEVLVSIQGTVGRVAIAPDHHAGSNVSRTLAVIPPAKQDLAHWIRVALLSPKGQDRMRDESGGTTRASLNLRDLRIIPLPVPPLNEQRRIVAKLDALQAHSRAAREALDAIPALLDRFRQSVLAAAFRGDLTREWRQNNPDVEPASVLLERIRAERRVRWIAAEAEKARARAEARAHKKGQSWGPEDDEKALAAGRKKAEKKYTEPEPVDAEAEGLPELPEEWCWASLDELLVLVTSGSRGWGKYYSNEGPSFIRAQDIKHDHLATQVAHVSLPDGAEGLRTLVEEQDLLVTITGANVTKAARVDRNVGEAYVSQHVALCRPVETEMSPFIHHGLIAEACGRGQLLKLAYGGGKPGLNLDNIRSVRVAMPPIQEQQHLLHASFTAMERLSSIDVATASACARLDTLDQTILAKAFCGELVPQDPNDEPASVLLERIRAEREAAAKKCKAKRKRKSS